MSTRDRVRELRAAGLSAATIARELGLSKPTISYHCRRLGEQPDGRFGRRYDWAEIQRYYDAGHSITKCQEKFGFARCTWTAAVRRGDVVSRPQAMSVELLLADRRSRSHVKRRLISAGLLDAGACAACGISSWLGQRLVLELHHINGDGHDNRLENLQLLCPNCHSQTENFSGRNKRRRAA